MFVVPPPINVTFSYVSMHTLQNAGGLVNANPPIPHADRLYVIYNTSTIRPVYVGSAANGQARFNPRQIASREMGLSQNDLNPIWIFIVQVFLNGVGKHPGNDGIVVGGGHAVDVEHLLIRTYIGHYNWNVRNINKTGMFNNFYNTVLNWTLVNNAGIPGWVGAVNLNLGPGNTI